MTGRPLTSHSMNHQHPLPDEHLPQQPRDRQNTSHCLPPTLRPGPTTLQPTRSWAMATTNTTTTAPRPSLRTAQNRPTAATATCISSHVLMDRPPPLDSVSTLKPASATTPAASGHYLLISQASPDHPLPTDSERGAGRTLPADRQTERQWILGPLDLECGQCSSHLVTL